ncbi:PREDICTED: uncharacterized protein LOC105558060 [Vollenhovia emeryi]|uniref:uncharacterized protein LOC105558060 n=1 Tax=Vollenhovia emeryi TaxID=411798 RepID=UPI0005F57828|nr:PREDICTED: uncharacterized protein LOC105558060 [Vollenhovia emeryi]
MMRAPVCARVQSVYFQPQLHDRFLSISIRMANKLESGFVKADARNLPRIDMFMILDFIKKSDNFNCGEVRNVKLAASSRTSYGDQAIGYVCLKRDGEICESRHENHPLPMRPYATELRLHSALAS